MTSKEEWVKKAAEQYRKNGLFEPNDGMIGKNDSEVWAQQILEVDNTAIDKDPVEVANSFDVSNWFGKDDEDK